MQIVELFYCVLWISFVSIIWFYTDTVVYYLQLLNLKENFRHSFASFVNKYPDKFLPDYLFSLSLKTDNRLTKFVLKLLSCVFCTTFWLSLIAAFLCTNLLLIGPIYVFSILTILYVKRML